MGRPLRWGKNYIKHNSGGVVKDIVCMSFDLPTRKPNRLKFYDYAQSGFYFVTVCIEGKRNLLGKVVNEQMIKNELGDLVEKWWLKIPNKFPKIILDEYVVMPNHFHGIIHIPVFDLSQISIPTILQWFKSMSSNEYLRQMHSGHGLGHIGKFWQRGYHDRIVRNETELFRIREYILNNPSNWNSDSL